MKCHGPVRVTPESRLEKNVNILDMSVLYTDRTEDVALSWGICLACVRLQAQSPMLQRNDKSRQKPTLVKE